jgi:hypothetical protein
MILILTALGLGNRHRRFGGIQGLGAYQHLSPGLSRDRFLGPIVSLYLTNGDNDCPHPFLGFDLLVRLRRLLH